MEMKRFKFEGWGKLEELGLEDVEMMNVLEDEEIIVVFGDDIKKFEKEFGEDDSYLSDEDVLDLVSRNDGGYELLSEIATPVYDEEFEDGYVVVKELNINGNKYFLVDTANGSNVVHTLKQTDLDTSIIEKIED